MLDLTKKVRTAIFCSVIYLLVCIVFIIADDDFCLLIIPLLIGWSIFWGLKAESVQYMKEYAITLVILSLISGFFFGGIFFTLLFFSTPAIFPFGIWWIRQGD